MYFRLSDAIVFLKRQGYPIDGTNVSYYSSIFSAFVNCNTDPVSEFVYIAGKDLEIIADTPSLRLRFEKSLAPQYRDENDDSSEKEEEEIPLMLDSQSVIGVREARS